MSAETNTQLAPFPTAPHFDVTPLQRRAYRAGMREAWLDRAEAWFTEATEAYDRGDLLTCLLRRQAAQTALATSRSYRLDTDL